MQGAKGSLAGTRRALLLGDEENMKKDLTLYETRVIGVLLEKEIVTPEVYPLSLNALTNACNQKSNRHPVLDLSEATVADTLGILHKKGLVRVERLKTRVEKYAHRFCNSEFGELRLTPRQIALVAELLLRGPQTPGELRSRASRLAAFAAVEEVEEELLALVELPGGPWVRRLPLEAGRREHRYAHLFSAEIEAEGRTEGETAAQGGANPDLVYQDAGHRIAGHRDAGHRNAGHRDAGDWAAALAEITELKARNSRLMEENEQLRRRLMALGEVC